MNPSSHQTEQQDSQLVFGQPSANDFSHSKNLTPALSIDELKTKGEIRLIPPFREPAARYEESIIYRAFAVQLQEFFSLQFM